MARKRDRIFAGFGAFLFLGSACALTIFAIVQPGSSNTNPANDTTQTSQQTCTESSVTASKQTVPQPYVPTGSVTSLQVTDLQAGTGPAAQAGDCLQVKYYGTLASNGTKFDENFDDTTALQFQLGKGEVITGWDQGLVGLKVGGTRRLVIPAAQAYGSQSPSSAIPANSALVFVVQLLKIKDS